MGDFDVVVVGSSNIDLVSYTPKFPSPGETIMGGEFAQGFGGKGANQAVLIGKLGGKVAMVSKVGQDSFGADFKRNYQQVGVDSRYVGDAEPGVATGTAAIIVDSAGENCIVVCPGANMKMVPEDVDAAAELMQKTKVVVMQNEIPLPVTQRALEVAKKAGACTIWNIAPCPAEAKDYPPEMFQLTDVLCVNESEAQSMGGVDGLLAKGVGVCLITLGKDGCKVVTKDGQQHLPGVVVPAGKVVDTTGAGDAFTGAFALFKGKGLGDAAAAEAACKIAALTVQKKGTQSSYPTHAEAVEAGAWPSGA